MRFTDVPAVIPEGYTAPLGQKTARQLISERKAAMTTPAPAEPRVSDEMIAGMLEGGYAGTLYTTAAALDLRESREREKQKDATIASQAAELAEAREILAGTDAGSLPNDMPLARIAEIRMDERHKYLWQVRDTCTRAEAAEAALKAAREALEHLADDFHNDWSKDTRHETIRAVEKFAKERLAALSPPTKEPGKAGGEVG